MDTRTMTGAETFLRMLASMGVERIFASPGSEWAPVWEQLARTYPESGTIPRYTSTRHEEVALGMASGYAKATGKLPAVMIHTTVGSLHGAMAMRGALHDNLPMVIFCGESIGFGHEPGPDPGAQWLGSLVDIGGPARLLAPCVKWSYGLNAASALASTVQRACQIAMSAPRGPVFVSLPMEYLFDVTSNNPPAAATLPIRATAAPQGIAQLADLLAAAKNPVIVTEPLLPAVAAVAPDVIQIVTGKCERPFHRLVGHPPVAGIDVQVARAVLQKDAQRLRLILADERGITVTPAQPDIRADGAEHAAEGIRPLPRRRELCDEFGTLLIFDEVVTGFRLGMGGAQGYFEVKPDLTVFGKCITGGYPMAGGVGGRKDVIMTFAAGIGGTGERAYIGGTLSANPLSCVAGYYALLEMEKTDAPVIAGQAGDRLTTGLKAIIKKYELPFVAYNQGSIVHLETAGTMLLDFKNPYRLLKELKPRKHMMEEMGAAYMANGLITLAGSRMYTSMADSDVVIDDALVLFENVLKECQ